MSKRASIFAMTYDEYLCRSVIDRGTIDLFLDTEKSSPNKKYKINNIKRCLLKERG